MYIIHRSFHVVRCETLTYLSIQREYLALLVQLRWAMSEPLYVGRAITDAHVFVKPITILKEIVAKYSNNYDTSQRQSIRSYGSMP